jgi:WD40 repeat protein
VEPSCESQREVDSLERATHAATPCATRDTQTAAILGSQGSFVVGTDGGTVYRCMFLHSSQMEAEFTRALAEPDGRKPTLRSPVKAEFRAHAGPVHAVDCSPFQRNVFASCGIDGTVRVYTTLQSEPVVLLEPASVYLYGVQWSPFRPLVMAVSTGDGRIALYDLLASKQHPARVRTHCCSDRRVSR